MNMLSKNAEYFNVHNHSFLDTKNIVELDYPGRIIDNSTSKRKYITFFAILRLRRYCIKLQIKSIQDAKILATENILKELFKYLGVNMYFCT